MFLTPDDLWRLARLFAALATGLASVVLGFLLARRTKNPVFRSFAVLTTGFLSFATGDFLTRFWWTHAAWNSLPTLISGSLFLVSASAIVRALILFSGELAGRPVSPWEARLLWIPVGLAAATTCSLFVPFFHWTASLFQAAGISALAVLLLAVVFVALRWLRGHRRIQDRTMRRLAVGTGVLLLAFVPVWILESLRIVQWGGFAWFFLIWNILALVLMARTQFQPREERPALFQQRGLDACAARFGLSAREAEVAGLHARGYSSSEIADKLFIAPKTVRNHVANIYAKTGVHQRVALTALLADYSEA